MGAVLPLLRWWSARRAKGGGRRGCRARRGGDPAWSGRRPRAARGGLRWVLAAGWEEMEIREEIRFRVNIRRGLYIGWVIGFGS